MKIIVYILAIVLGLIFIYGAYLAAKTVSYKLFYQGMVEQTVKDMVKPEYLKK